MSDEALARLRRATRARAAAREEWRAAIVGAYARGVPIRQIGEAADVSHIRVLQIVHSGSAADGDTRRESGSVPQR